MLKRRVGGSQVGSSSLVRTGFLGRPPRQERRAGGARGAKRLSAGVPAVSREGRRGAAKPRP
jgi:hypothetical protein